MAINPRKIPVEIIPRSGINKNVESKEPKLPPKTSAEYNGDIIFNWLSTSNKLA